MNAYKYAPHRDQHPEGKQARPFFGFVQSRRSFFRLFATCLTAALIIVQPLKNHAWNNILVAGDNALAARQFNLARTEYTKLKLVRPGDPLPHKLLQETDEAEHNILSLRHFYEARNDSAMLARMDEATRTYASPDQATLACQELAKQNELELALVCISNATTNWPNYRDGWLTERVIAQSLGRGDLAEYAHQKALEIDPMASN